MTTPSVGIGAEANQSDRMFVTMMIPHHQQAIEMADTLLAKGGIDPRVTDLAQQIKAAQGPEIELMEGWLEAWDVPMDAMGGMGDGMMSGDDMAALDAAAGEEATRLFLEQMVHHHQGAIEMAEAEIEGGKAPEVLALAQAVIEAQSTEIATMQQLLGTM
jgi:uncharacterized protein (DUF305 family)